MYNIIADLHTHTLASTHAYSTVQEMAVSAREKGLFALALTDHARTMPGAPGPWFFTALRELPLLYKGVLLLAGMEANVLDFSGALDIIDEERRRMDWVVASIHNIGLKGLENPTAEKCTQLWLNIAHDPVVNVIGHLSLIHICYNAAHELLSALGMDASMMPHEEIKRELDI